jgi:dihydrofolate reductase
VGTHSDPSVVARSREGGHSGRNRPPASERLTTRCSRLAPLAAELDIVGRQQEASEMKASVFVGTSLDGFIARTNGSFDFLPTGGGEPHGYDEFIATVDAIVMGRNTFEVVAGFPSWPYGKKPVFVLSTRALATVPPGAVVERMSGAPAEIVSQLSVRGIRHIYVDGGITIQRFLRARLIQHIIITRVPVIIGNGIPLFGGTLRDILLKHVATRQYASGLVQSEYEVTA